MDSSPGTADGPAPGLDRIGQIGIRVRDLDRAIAFYRDVLGMRFLFQAPPGLAFFDCGGIRLMLGTPEKDEFDHPASIIYYDVDDIRAAHQAIAGRGATFVDEPHVVARLPHAELWMCFLRDPDDNVLALMSEVEPGQG